MLADVVTAPFNGSLSEKVEEFLAGTYLVRVPAG